MSTRTTSATVTLLVAMMTASGGLPLVTQAQSLPSQELMANNPALFLKTARTLKHWDEPAPPVKLFGPVYFVGTRGLSSYLITGTDGHVLLYTGMPGSGEMIEKSIVKLGFKPTDVKILLTGHAHCDHVGGHAHLKKVTGAKIAMMKEEVALFESGGKLDFHYGDCQEFAFDAAKVDTVFRDQDEIKLGDITIKALLTPGHTKGSTTYVMQIADQAKTYTVVFPDGTSVNPGYRVVTNPSYAGIGDNFRQTFRTLESLKPDIWLASHNEVYGLDAKLARVAQEGTAAWVDPEGYEKLVAAVTMRFNAAVKRETDAVAKTEAPVRVTVDNFIRAETDNYFAKFAHDGALGKFVHQRELAPIEHQAVIRMNRDTLYSQAVFDLDAGPVTITLPETSKRFMAAQIINEDHYTPVVFYQAGAHKLTRQTIGTRYVLALVRTFINPNDAADVKAVHALQDAIKIEQQGAGTFQAPNWDQVSLKEIREALNALATANGGINSAKMFGRKEDVDPVQHLIGTAAGWGGNPPTDAYYIGGHPDQNDGKTVYRLTVKDVPVDGFWSVSVYNKEGYFQKNAENAYTLNNVTAKPNADGSVTIQFGGGDGKTPNCLPITPEWNYLVRMYRPRKEILDGTWKLPPLEPVK